MFASETVMCLLSSPASKFGVADAPLSAANARNHVVDTVARARGGVVHTRGITSHSPGGASCAPVMPQVGPTWGLPQACDAPGGGGLVGV